MEDFDPDDQDLCIEDGCSEFISTSESTSEYFAGDYAVYPSRGFTLDIKFENHLQFLDKLASSPWIDNSTRALKIDWTVQD